MTAFFVGMAFLIFVVFLFVGFIVIFFKIDFNYLYTRDLRNLYPKKSGEE